MQLDEIQGWLGATESNNADDDGKENNEQLARLARLDHLKQLAPMPATANDDNDNSDRPVKRRRLDTPITPPSSCPNDASNMASPSKRPLDDATPRAKRVQTAAFMPEHSYPSLSSASDQSPSSSRRNPSPQKHLRTLALHPRGLDVRDMYDVKDTMARPPMLRKLLVDIEAFSDGQGIVAKDAQDALRKAADADDRFAWALRAGAPHVSDDEELLGRCPPPSTVRKVMKAAFQCNARRHPEATWNLEVHQRILDMALRPTEETDFENLVDFMGCTTASIMREYGTPTLAKKVDFCVYIDPENDPSLSPEFLTAASFVRSNMPEEVLGFADFAPLDGRFIALSIETKKPSENFEAAELQLGVWDMARWAFLRRLAELRSGPPDQAGGADVNIGRQDVKLPEFLPGIIVQGHDWYLVMTTMEGGKTVLWQKVSIGMTSTPRGVYQIVRALQYLEKWARDVHWPWLRDMIQGIAVVYA